MNENQITIYMPIEKRQGLKVACLDEIAYRMNYIDADQVKKLAIPLLKSAYGKYLLNLVKYDEVF